MTRQLIVALMLLAVSCKDPETNNIKSFIPGTYSKKVINEFNSGETVLLVKPVSGNIYSITRISTFRKKRNGKLLPLVKKTETWTAIYNSNEQVLHETQKGKIISFIPNNNLLLVGSSEYKKIKK